MCRASPIRRPRCCSGCVCSGDSVGACVRSSSMTRRGRSWTDPSGLRSRPSPSRPRDARSARKPAPRVDLNQGVGRRSGVYFPNSQKEEGPMLDLSRGQKAWSPIAPIWQWCRDWISPDSRLDPTSCPKEEIERMARDLRMPAADLLSASRRGPQSADLLKRRLAALDLDQGEIARTEPGMLRDLQRACTMCASHRRCARDFARDPATPGWKDYCPNAATLMALDAMPWASRREW